MRRRDHGHRRPAGSGWAGDLRQVGERLMLQESQIESIVQQVMSELRQGERVRHGPMPEPPPVDRPPAAPAPLKHASNLFPDVDSAVQAAGQAFQRLHELPLALREQMISHVRRISREHAQLLAHEAVQETGMGRVEDKTEKNLLNANKTPGTEFLPATAWTGDGGLRSEEHTSELQSRLHL